MNVQFKAEDSNLLLSRCVGFYINCQLLQEKTSNTKFDVHAMR